VIKKDLKKKAVRRKAQAQMRKKKRVLTKTKKQKAPIVVRKKRWRLFRNRSRKLYWTCKTNL
jgi:hypothetical protein